MIGRHAFRDAALVALVALALHARSIAFGFTDLDDRDLIVDDHAALADPSILWRAFTRSYMHVVDPSHAYYRPIVTLSYALDARLGGVHAAAYHSTNVALFAALAVVVLALLRRLGFGLEAALVFTVHPALVPAVAWIPGRNDLLLALFAIGAWLAFARAKPFAHAVCLALALLTKEAAIAVPFVCILHACFLDRPRAAALPKYAPCWIALLALRAVIHAPHASMSLENLGQLVSGAGAILVPFDPKTIAVPADLPAWPGALAIVAIAAATRLVPGVRARVVLFGACVYAVTLAPSVLIAGPLVLGQRLVLPAVGLVIAAFEIVRALAIERRTVVAFGAVAIAALAAISFAVEGSFVGPRAFAKSAVLGSPHSALAHLALGQSYQTGGDAARALEEYRAAIALGPAEVAHNNVAVLYMADARWPEAEAELRAELALNPNFPKAHFNLAVVLRREGRLAEACAEARRTLDLGLTTDAARKELERTCTSR